LTEMLILSEGPVNGHGVKSCGCGGLGTYLVQRRDDALGSGAAYPFQVPCRFCFVGLDHVDETLQFSLLD